MKRNGAHFGAATGLDYQRLFEALPGLYMAILPDDPIFTVVAISDEFAKLIGIPRQEILGRGLMSILPPDSLQASLKRVLAAKQPDLMPVQWYAGGPEIRYLSPLNSPVLDEEGNVQYIIHRVDDVTEIVQLKQLDAEHGKLADEFAGISDLQREQKWAEQELRRYKEFFNRVPVGLSVGFPNGTFGPVNPAFAAMLGRTTEEMYGMPIESVFSPEGIPQLLHARNEVDRKGSHEWEGTYVRKDGSRFPVHIDLKGVWDAEHRLLYRIASVTDITERKRAEAERLRQWHTFDTALSHTPDSTYIFDLEYRFTYANRTLLSILNKPLDAVVGKTFHELGYPTELADRLTSQIQEVIATGKVARGETARTYNGVARHYEYIFVPVIGASGVEAVAGSTRDITDRKSVEMALRESEVRSRFFGEISEKSLTLTDPSAIIAAIVKLLGEHLRASRCAYADVDSDSDKFTILHDHTTDGISSTVGTYQLSTLGLRMAADLRAGKAVVIREGLCCPLVKSGRLVAMLIVHDVHARDWTEPEISLVQEVAERCWGYVERIAERKRMEAVLQQVFAQAPVAVAVLRGRELVYELANDRYCEFFPGRELLGRKLLDVVPEIDDNMRRILENVLDTGEPFVGNEYLIPVDRDRDGVMEDCWFTFVYQPLHDPDGRVSGMVVVAVDVTTHVRARQGLELANRDLEEFAYVASHDLQEPLRMVNIYTQLMMRELGPNLPPEASVHAAFVRNGVKRMAELLTDLLNFSRSVHSETLQVSSLANLNESLSEAVATLHNRIEEEGALITWEGLPVVRGDRGHFTQVFQNLFSNAIKYRRPNEPPIIRVTCATQGGEYVIRVCDNGIGFEQEHAARIFQPFRRLHSQHTYPGTGIGLAICSKIVEAHGGRIWAESSPGKGSTFLFALPQKS